MSWETRNTQVTTGMRDLVSKSRTAKSNHIFVQTESNLNRILSNWFFWQSNRITTCVQSWFKSNCDLILRTYATLSWWTSNTIVTVLFTGWIPSCCWTNSIIAASRDISLVSITAFLGGLETTCCHHVVMVNQQHYCNSTFYRLDSFLLLSQQCHSTEGKGNASLLVFEISAGIVGELITTW